jgi:hypothetical protein
MLLTKNQIESIRYQLKKNNVNASNEEIRLVSNDFSDFDAILIADKIISNKSNSLSIKSDDLDNSMIDLYQSNQKSELSKSEKNNLIKIKSLELGIDLSISEIEKIADIATLQISESMDFLDNVNILISDYFNARNNKIRNSLNQKIDDISNIINAKNSELADIFDGTNQRLIDIASDCNREKNDYKSPYRDKLESIKEMLKLSA